MHRALHCPHELESDTTPLDEMATSQWWMPVPASEAINNQQQRCDCILSSPPPPYNHTPLMIDALAFLALAFIIAADAVTAAMAPGPSSPASQAPNTPLAFHTTLAVAHQLSLSLLYILPVLCSIVTIALTLKAVTIFYTAQSQNDDLVKLTKGKDHRGLGRSHTNTSILSFAALAVYAAGWYAQQWVCLTATAAGLDSVVAFLCAFFTGGAHLVLGVQALVTLNSTAGSK